MSSGYKSGLWFERLSSKISAVKGGYVSPTAFWIGGVSSRTTVSVKSGYKSFLAFWMGGASAIITPPAPPAPIPVVVESRRWPGPSTLLYGEWDYPTWHKKREEEEIIFL